MSYKADLFKWDNSTVPVTPGLPLVVALSGFTDAGSAVHQTREYLTGSTEQIVIGHFDNDELYDYRARRPEVQFHEDHLQSYQLPKLEIAICSDALGGKFLLLSGYEPDFRWERFVDEVIALSLSWEVSRLVWAHAIPMPVPHTRGIGATISGNQKDFAAEHSVWKPTTTVPSTIGHLLEYRFVEAGFEVVGFVLLVPHYLADTEYPGSALAVIDLACLATGLVFDVSDLQEKEQLFLAKITDQIDQNPELTTMLSGLEERYDSYRQNMESDNIQSADIPSADELAAELERYLANRVDEGDNGSWQTPID